MTGQTSTEEPSSSFLANRMWYGFTQAVATEYFLEMARPAETSSSVMVGWRREWSIIFARSGSEVRTVLGRVDAMVRYGRSSMLK